MRAMTDIGRAPLGVRWIALLLLVGTAFAIGRWRRDGHDHAPAVRDEAESPPARDRMYTCSMHPRIRSPDPRDKCPICAMDLIPVPSDGDDPAGEGAVPRLRLSEAAMALMEVRTWPVERRVVEVEIPLFGKIGFDERAVWDLVARTEAYVERLAVNAPWQLVQEGEILAELYSPAAVTAFREWLLVRDGPVDARASARARLIRMGVSGKQADAVAESGDVPRTFSVATPRTGTALPMDMREGTWLREGERLARVADLSRVWANLEAYERDLPWLAENLPVRLQVAAYPGEEFEGAVSFVEPVVNERTRTVRLRVEMDNAGGRLKPDMLVSGRLRAVYRPVSPAEPAMRTGDEPPAAVLVIPVSAPLIMGRRALVYVRTPHEEGAVFEPRTVVLGPRGGDVYVVLDGLEAGEEVVVNGQFKIDSELQIRGRPSMMTAALPEGPPAVAVESRRQTECPVMGGGIDPDLFVDVDGYRIYPTFCS